MRCCITVSESTGACSISSTLVQGPAPDPLAQAAWAVDVSQDDHPLSTSSGSKWREFFKVRATAAGL